MKVGDVTFQASAVVVLGVKDEFPLCGEVVEVYVANTNRVLLYTQEFWTH